MASVVPGRNGVEQIAPRERIAAARLHHTMPVRCGHRPISENCGADAPSASDCGLIDHFTRGTRTDRILPLACPDRSAVSSISRSDTQRSSLPDVEVPISLKCTVYASGL